MYLVNRAFRLFFLGSISFAFISMAIWWGIWNYPTSFSLNFASITPTYWHAHEMIYGYALATVAGFLLTAVLNWTRLETASGIPLGMVFIAWLIARVGFIADFPLVIIALADMAYLIGVFGLFVIPVWQRKLKVQTGLSLLFLLIILSNLMFYYASFAHTKLLLPSLVLGLFLVLTINLTMIRRLVPFFTEKSLQIAPPKNNDRLDTAILAGFLALMLVAAFLPNNILLSFVSFPLATIFAIRQVWWYRNGVWRQNLLWPLHLSHAFITLGIFFYGLVGLKLLTPTLAIHALAAGGIGLLCSAIVARISLGHTNRNIYDTPKGLIVVFITLAFGATIRAIFPAIFPDFYLVWVQVSQLSWIAGFLLLFILYFKILALPEVPRNTGILL